MTASSVVGAWFKSYGAEASVPINDSSYVYLPIISQQPVNVPNVGLSHDNDGTLRNTIGSTVELETFCGLQGVSNVNGSRVDFRFAISADKLSWEVVGDDFNEIFGTDTSYWSVRAGLGVFDVPPDYYVGIVAKVESGVSPQNFRVLSGFMHVRSTDGGNNPAIDAFCSTVSAGGYFNWQLSTVGTWRNYNGGMTLSSETRGIIHNGSSRYDNDTGETQEVDGWFYFVTSTNSISSSRRQLFELSTDGISDKMQGYAAVNRNNRSSGWVYYVASIDDGQHVQFRGQNNQTSGIFCRTYSLTHNARSR